VNPARVTTAQPDLGVYALAGLTEGEIKMVEGAAK